MIWTNCGNRPGGPIERFFDSALLKVFLAGLCFAVGGTVPAMAGNQSAFLPMLKPVDAIASIEPAAQGPAGSGASVTRSTVTVKQGDSLVSALVAGGLSRSEAYRNMARLKGIDARRLQPGDRLTLSFIGTAAGRKLASVSWIPRRGRGVTVALLPGKLPAGGAAADGESAPGPQVADAQMSLKTMVLHGSRALARQLTESGLPPQVCEQVIMALQQSRRPPVHGEVVKIVYQAPLDPETGPAPQLRYAAYTGRDGKQHVFRYTALATPASLQHIDLTPATQVILWEPLPGARISSPFGWRVHPVLHTRKFHKGVDYEAALGTPVIAAADGVVEDIGRRGTYGNYIRLRHTDRLETAYAHLSGFSPTLGVGTPVHRGDVIGYVGMTGIATGPHLYYELLIDGRQIDPESAAFKDAIRRQQVPQTASIPLP